MPLNMFNTPLRGRKKNKTISVVNTSQTISYSDSDDVIRILDTSSNLVDISINSTTDISLNFVIVGGGGGGGNGTQTSTPGYGKGGNGGNGGNIVYGTLRLPSGNNNFRCLVGKGGSASGSNVIGTDGFDGSASFFYMPNTITVSSIYNSTTNGGFKVYTANGGSCGQGGSGGVSEENSANAANTSDGSGNAGTGGRGGKDYTNSLSTANKNGKNGMSFTIKGVSYTFSGGGGGAQKYSANDKLLLNKGTGGNGGGGTSAYTQNTTTALNINTAQPGTANTGGGGGGGVAGLLSTDWDTIKNSAGQGANGGSGIIILYTS